MTRAARISARILIISTAAFGLWLRGEGCVWSAGAVVAFALLFSEMLGERLGGAR